MLSADYAAGPPTRHLVERCQRQSTVTVNMLEAGTMYGNRVNQLDLRLAKLLRFGTTRSMIGVDIYNALNTHAILTYNNTFVPGGTWLQPQSILTARMVKVSAEFTF